MRVPGARPRIPPGIWTETYCNRKDDSEPAREGVSGRGGVEMTAGVSAATVKVWQKINAIEATTRIRALTRLKAKSTCLILLRRRIRKNPAD